MQRTGVLDSNKARMLSDEDLVQVMMWRKEKQDKKSAKGTEAAKGSTPDESDVDVSLERVDQAQS